MINQITEQKDRTEITVPIVDIDPFSEEFLADPYAYYAALRDAGPVIYLSAYNIYAMARFSEVQAALKDWQSFCSARGAGLTDFAREKPWRTPSLLIETDPPIHDRVRKVVAEVMSLSALKANRTMLREKAEILVDDLVSRGSFDAVTELAERFPLIVFPELVGMREGAEEHLLPYAALAFNALGPRNRLLEDAACAAVDAVKWVEESCRRENLRPGGWGAQVYDAVDRGVCTEDEASLLVRSFLGAGVDTTINGIGNMLYAFATHPGEWAKLRANPALIKRVFDESLRWDSTIQTFFRTTNAPVAVGDAVIPADSKVVLFLAAANRDPRQWKNPDLFDITRPAGGHVGFGFGIHQCLGQMLARLEAEVVLEALLSRIADIQLAGPVVRRLNNTLHAFESMPVSITPA
nr:cytochrome P450 [Sphingomonas sp. CDS-1]